MKKIVKYMNPKNMLYEIQLYGYHYSLRKHIFLIGGMLAGLIGLAKMLGLTWGQITILAVVMLMFIPFLVLQTFVGMYEQKKFVDIGNYLEQMLYSFRRKSKIINALEDTAILFPDGVMGETIEKTLEHVTVLETEGDLYGEAFAIMEKEYGCSIVKRIHDFMIRVELSGGEHRESSDILIQDRNKWVMRVLETQKEKQLVKRNVTIGIVLSLIVVLGTVFMVPNELVDVKTNLLSQISSMATLIINFLLWIFVQNKLSGSWISEEKNITEEQIEKYYMSVMFPVNDNKTVKTIVVAVLMSACVVFSFLTENIIGIMIGIMISGIVITDTQRKYKLNRKRLQREVEKSFPDWMMSLSLLLQTENVQGAIAQSIQYAPIVLRGELEIMLDKMEQQPTSIEPYLGFYETLNLPDLQSAMRMLYSMSQSGGEEMSKQINALVERNSELQNQSMKLKVEDYLAGMSFCVLVPMIIGCGKLLVDMAILLFSLMNHTQGLF